MAKARCRNRDIVVGETEWKGEPGQMTAKVLVGTEIENAGS